MMKKKRLYIVTTLCWTAIIFWFSLQPGDVSGAMSGSLVKKIISLFLPAMSEFPQQMEMLEYIVRKSAHIIEFMILGVWSILAVLGTQLKFKAVNAMLFCLVIASVDETIQLFVSGRAGRVTDVLIDGTGALLGIIIVSVLLRRRIISANS